MFGVNYNVKLFNNSINEHRFLEKEIQKFIASPQRHEMILGEIYYNGEHDILKRRRKVIGEGGKLSEIKNLPNNKIVDNQYAKMVDQKNNYFISKPITYNSSNHEYVKMIEGVFDKRFMRLIKNMGEDCLNHGLSWLYIYHDQNGKLAFKRFKGYEVLPFWKDEEHTVLDKAVRIYEVEGYEGEREVKITKVEVYNSWGIDRFILNGTRLVRDHENPSDPYITKGSTHLTWDKIPLIAFKYNNKEIPLITRVKTLQDALNTMRSDFMNNMQEDARNTILVLKNYDGTNLGEFRKNLSEYGVVKVKSVDGCDGGVDTINVEVNANNYTVILDMLKKAIIENARGYDARDERMSNSPNQMNIKSMYSDIDLDANGMEVEWQASIEQLLWFVNNYFVNIGLGDYRNENIEIIYNKDHIINETEVINNCKNSAGIISNDTIISQHPWVMNVSEEIQKLSGER